MSQSGLVTTAGEGIPLLGVEVVAEVVAGHSRVKVRQRYRNGAAKPVEAVYVFPLPSAATLVGFAMTANGRRMEGVVKEREEAFRTYDDAIVAGHGAALLEEERKNVFTASVGNLLPGEETLIEIETVERVHADQGSIRWMMPTLVAPRYIPGARDPKGDRTAHGSADPTAQVPDADRITPKIASVSYGLKLDLVFDLGAELEIECPSHRLNVTRVGGKTSVAFTQGEVALDRDVVVIARGVAAGPLVSLLADEKDGVIALSVIPDLTMGRAPGRQDVCFLVDTSGSMDGASIVEARAALRLCLRHLREGDRFNIIAFESSFRRFAVEPVPFTQRTLEAADAWVQALVASGGTELLAPMLDAMHMLPDGTIVLLTDGQVGNEDEIARKTLAARRKARIYTFGIGTNVSDALLRELSGKTGGALEMIHPGERIDEKVVAQFSRALAPRVENVKVSWTGIDVGELAPAEPPVLVDGEPWTVLGKVNGRAAGTAEIRGTLDGQAFHLAVPVDLRETTARPGLVKLWAAARIADLEQVEVTGARATRMKERIVALAVAHGIACKYASFVVVEERTGDRRASGQPATVAIPVNAPAGWAMFDKKADVDSLHVNKVGAARGAMQTPARTGMPMMKVPAPMPASVPAQAFGGVPGAAGGGGPQSPPPAPRAYAMYSERDQDDAPEAEAYAAVDSSLASGYAMPESKPSGVKKKLSMRLDMPKAEPKKAEKTELDPIVAILGRQLASGLWDEPGALGNDTNDGRSTRATARALLELNDLGVDANHALHGGLVKKAVQALLAIVPRLAAAEAELAVAVCWLVSLGGRTRKAAEALAVASLKPLFGDEQALRQRIAALI
jgi:Ca-activated chloride channel family protein